MERKDGRHRFHLMPPEGWMNDPNGLSYYRGQYHVFFQYVPGDASGRGLKHWGHYVSPDLIHWDFVGIAISPDIPEDRNGAYSGSAFTDDGLLEVFYTGNVKLDGNHDYFNTGREANVIYTVSEDGKHFGMKEVLLRNADYPETCSLHVRDPKVRRAGEEYRMLLGAARRDGAGEIVEYVSHDKKHWSIRRQIGTGEKFGYMWECPDFFRIEGTDYLSFCPQGMEDADGEVLNHHRSGYVATDESEKKIPVEKFRLWDCGFDFYAPQTLKAPDGRILLLGWAGVPDPDYGNGPAVAAGWQHSMTCFREVLPADEGYLRTLPVIEYERLRNSPVTFGKKGETWTATVGRSFDLVADAGEEFLLELNGELTLAVANGTATLQLTPESGDGRRERKTRCERAGDVRVLMDGSLVEIFLDGGRTVFTTRYYPDGERVTVCVQMTNDRNQPCIELWEMSEKGV